LLALALVLAVVAGLEPSFSDRAPERLNLRYVEQAGKAWWLADPVDRLPESLKAAAHFSDRPERRVQFGYVAAAGSAQFPAPSAAIRRAGDAVTINLNAAGAGVALLVPKEAGLKAVSLGGVTVPAYGGRMTVSCATPDCGSAQMVLQLSSAAPVDLTLIAYRHGLPPQAAALLKARPAWAVPSQSGDATLLAATLRVPAR
jgi:hypothetical protein